MILGLNSHLESDETEEMPLPTLRPISVVVRSMNDASVIGETLRGVYTQNFPEGVRLIHIDSGSTDGTVDLIKAGRPWKLIQIQPREYIPGVVLNCGMREADSEWVVFLNSDAKPVDGQWLAALLRAALSEPGVGAVFSRQVPRPDCRAVFAHDYDLCFGPHRASASWDHFFSMVSCAVNRRAWEAQPFREDLQYAEDDEWSRRLKAHGWKILFAPESRAMHSHNYTLRQAYRRAYGDTFASAATATTPVRNYNWLHTVLLGALRDSLRDFRYCREKGRLLEWPHAAAVRLAQRRGKRDGYRAGWKHYGRDVT